MCNRLLIVLVGIIPAVRSVLWVGSGQESGSCGSHAQVSQRQRGRGRQRGQSSDSKWQRESLVYNDGEGNDTCSLTVFFCVSGKVSCSVFMWMSTMTSAPRLPISPSWRSSVNSPTNWWSRTKKWCKSSQTCLTLNLVIKLLKVSVLILVSVFVKWLKAWSINHKYSVNTVVKTDILTVVKADRVCDVVKVYNLLGVVKADRLLNEVKADRLCDIVKADLFLAVGCSTWTSTCREGWCLSSGQRSGSPCSPTVTACPREMGRFIPSPSSRPPSGATPTSANRWTASLTLLSLLTHH